MTKTLKQDFLPLPLNKNSKDENQPKAHNLSKTRRMSNQLNTLNSATNTYLIKSEKTIKSF